MFSVVSTSVRQYVNTSIRQFYLVPMAGFGPCSGCKGKGGKGGIVPPCRSCPTHVRSMSARKAPNRAYLCPRKGSLRRKTLCRGNPCRESLRRKHLLPGGGGLCRGKPMPGRSAPVGREWKYYPYRVTFPLYKEELYLLKANSKICCCNTTPRSCYNNGRPDRIGRIHLPSRFIV